MEITIQYTGQLSGITGTSEEVVEVENDSTLRQLIDQLVGKPFPILKRLTSGAIGSQRFELVDGNEELQQKVLQTTNIPFCNIGLRPLGIKIWFSVRLHTYVLALPYEGLSITVDGQRLSLENSQWRLVLQPAHGALLNRRFVDKMLSYQSNPDRT